VSRDPFFSVAVHRSEHGTVDLTAATFVDPSGLRVLLAAGGSGRRLRVLCRRGGAVARLLALTGTERVLHVA
jgi:anti-anti-sigma regulatory factor